MGLGAETTVAKRLAGKVEHVHLLIIPFQRRLPDRPVWRKWSGTARITVLAASR